MPGVGVDRRIPAIGDVEGVHRVLDARIDGVAEGKPHPRCAAGVGEVVGGPGGIAAHQHLRSVGIVVAARVGSPWCGQRRQRLVQDDDVVTGGVGAGAAGAQQPGQGFPTGDFRAVQKRQQRMVPEGLLPGRGRFLLVVGVVDHQRGVDVDVQPATRCGSSSGGPGRRAGRGPRGPHPRQVRGVDPFVDQPPHRGRRGLRPEHVLTVTAQLADGVDAVRPVGDRGSQISEHFAGRIHPRPAVGIGQRGGDLP